MKKNSLFVLLFSMVPGAGEMYLGLMGKGVIIMTLFFGIIAVTAYLQLHFVILAVPVIWCYSFFDTINLKNLSHEERILMDREFMESIENFTGKNWRDTFGKRHLLIGGICILLGFTMLVDNFIAPYVHFLESIHPAFYNMFRNIPTFIVAVAIIYFGLYLIKGKKNNSQKNVEFIEFKEKENE